MRQLVKIPARRAQVVLGKNGREKEKLEASTGTFLAIDESGDIVVSGDTEGVLIAANVVSAIGRGFAPEKAMRLLNEENQLVVLSLERETGATIKRLFARVIGKDGRARKSIERLTGASIRVSGKTVSIIGNGRGLQAAREAVEDLLAGRNHGFVYAKLEKRKRLSGVQ